MTPATGSQTATPGVATVSLRPGLQTATPGFGTVTLTATSPVIGALDHPLIVQSRSFNDSGVTLTFTGAFTAAVSTGTILLAVVNYAGTVPGDGYSAVEDDAGNTFTKAAHSGDVSNDEASGGDGFGNIFTEVWYKLAPAAGGTQLTVHHLGNGAYHITTLTFLEVYTSGAGDIDSINAVALTTPATAQSMSLDITSGEMLIAALHPLSSGGLDYQPTGWTCSPSAGWTTLLNQPGAGHGGAGGAQEGAIRASGVFVKGHDTGLIEDTYTFTGTQDSSRQDAGVLLSVGLSAAMTAPAAPTTVVGTPLTSQSIRVTWLPTGLKTHSFLIEGSDDGNDPWVSLGASANNVYTFTEEGLVANTQRYYRIKAVGPGGTSAPSASATATSMVATVPTLLGVQYVTRTRIDLQWLLSSNDCLTSVVEYSTDSGGTWNPLATVVTADLPDTIYAGSAIYSHTGLTAGTRYDYRVYETTAAGPGDPCAAVHATTITASDTAPWTWYRGDDTDLYSAPSGFDWPFQLSWRSGPGGPQGGDYVTIDKVAIATPSGGTHALRIVIEDPLDHTSGSGATIDILAVDGSGGITDAVLNNPGTGYNVGGNTDHPSGDYYYAPVVQGGGSGGVVIINTNGGSGSIYALAPFPPAGGNPHAAGTGYHVANGVPLGAAYESAGQVYLNWNSAGSGTPEGWPWSCVPVLTPTASWNAGNPTFPDNYYNRIRIWCWVGTNGAPPHPTQRVNCNLGTFVKRITSPGNQEELGGGHFYFQFYTPTLGQWVQVIIPLFNPTYQRVSGAGSAGFGSNDNTWCEQYPTSNQNFQPHEHSNVLSPFNPTPPNATVIDPTSTYNFAKCFTGRYLAWDDPTGYPSTILVDELVFYRENNDECEDLIVGGMTGTYDDDNNVVHLEWFARKNWDDDHKVFWSFDDMHANGLPGSPVATIATSGTGYAQMHYELSGVTMGAHTVIYLAVQPQKNIDTTVNTRFMQIAVRLDL